VYAAGIADVERQIKTVLGRWIDVHNLGHDEKLSCSATRTPLPHTSNQCANGARSRFHPGRFRHLTYCHHMALRFFPAFDATSHDALVASSAAAKLSIDRRNARQIRHADVLRLVARHTPQSAAPAEKP
jgi:hypothetical protein